MIRTNLVPLAEEHTSELLLDAALSLAKRTNSHIHAIFIRPDPAEAITYVPEVILAAGVTHEAVERETRQAALAEKALFEAWQAPQRSPLHDRRPSRQLFCNLVGDGR